MTKTTTLLLTASAVTLIGFPVYAALSEECQSMLSGERLTIAVPNEAGGGYDTYARALAPALERHGGLSARVANMPSGGGRAAWSFVMNADDTSLVLLIENTADLVIGPMGTVGRGALAEKDFLIEGFQIVGIVYDEPSTWFGRAGIDLADPDIGPLVTADGTPEEALLSAFLTARTLGFDIGAVTGYDGTNEIAAAILRGEADFSGASLTTALKLAEDDGIDALLVMSDRPHPAAPDVPYLAGEGGLAWALSTDLPDEEAAQRRSLALAATRVQGTARGIFASTNLADDRRQCLADLMDIATADTGFVTLAEGQGRPVDPIKAADAQAFVADLIAAHAAILPTLTQLTAEVMD